MSWIYPAITWLHGDNYYHLWHMQKIQCDTENFKTKQNIEICQQGLCEVDNLLTLWLLFSPRDIGVSMIMEKLEAWTIQTNKSRNIPKYSLALEHVDTSRLSLHLWPLRAVQPHLPTYSWAWLERPHHSAQGMQPVQSQRAPHSEVPHIWLLCCLEVLNN